jgi:hypothetical protein
VMLPDLELSRRYAGIGPALAQLIAEEAARVPGYELLSAADVRAVLDQEAAKQLVGCSATDCLAEIAEAMDADLILSGRVQVADDGAPLVSLTLINARAIVVMNRVNLVWRGAEDRLTDVVRTATQLLILEPEKRVPGLLVLKGVPAGARVYVDGLERTADHDKGGVGGLTVGPHEVLIESPDKQPATLQVIVQTGKDVVVDVELLDEPVPAPLLWVGGISAVVLGGAVTVGIVYLAGQGDVALSARVGATDVETLRSLRK